MQSRSWFAETQDIAPLKYIPSPAATSRDKLSKGNGVRLAV